MSLYPVSTYNIGTGLNNGGLFDSIGTAVLTDQNGNIIATLNGGVITFVGGTFFNNTVYLNKSLSVGNGTGSVGQYLVSNGAGNAPLWVNLTVGNGALTISGGTHLSTSGTFTANQSGNSTISISTDATDSNIPSTIVSRDATGGFNCALITGSITGVAVTTATGAGFYYPTFVKGATINENLYAYSVLKFDFSSGTLYSTSFNGSLTGLASSATRALTLDTTTATAGTYYLPFVVSSLGGNGRTFYVDAPLSYSQATGTLSATNVSGTFTGTASVATRAITLDTTTAGAGTYYPLFSTSSTGGTSRTAYVDVGLSYTEATATLNCTNFNGLATVASRANTLDTTSATTTVYPMFSSTGTGGASRVTYVDIGISYNPTSDTLTTANFNGTLNGTATTATTVNTTTQPASTTYYLALTNANTGGTSKVVYTSAPSYNSGTSTLTVANISGTASVATRATLIDTTGDTANHYCYVPFVLNQTGTSQTLYTDGTAGYTLNYNPALGYLTSSAFQINDQTMTSKYWRLENIPANPSTMLFNNSWTGGHYPLQLDGTAGVASAQTNNLYCDGNTPDTYAQLDTPILTASTTPSGGTYTNPLLYMSTTPNDYTSFGTRGLNTGTGTGGSATVTLLVNGNNPMGRTLQTQVCLGVKMYASSAANRTFTYNLNSVTLSMTRNGSAFTNFYLNSGFSSTITRSYTITATSNTVFNLFDPLLNLDIYFEPTDSKLDDTYVMTVSYTYTISIAPLGGVFQEQIGNPAYAFMGLDCPAQSSTRLSGTGTFTFNQAQRVTPQTYSITKTLSTNNQTGWLQNIHVDNNVNLVFNQFFNTTAGVIFPYCFTGGFTNYKIYLQLTVGLPGNLLTFNLVDSTGTVKTSGYTGTLVQLAAAYSSTAWAGTGVPFHYIGNTFNDIVEYDICAPMKARAKIFKGYNVGNNPTMTIVSGGYASDSGLYPSLKLTPATNVQGYITIVGYNSRI